MAKNEKKDTKQKSSYFKEMKAELKKVVWPKPKELVNNTVAVIAFVLIVAIIVFVCDFCFDNLNKYGVTKLQEKVQSSFQTNNDSENTNQDSNEDTNETSNEDNSSTNNESEENLQNISVESLNETSTENNVESNE